jgi:hypothetical protein
MFAALLGALSPVRSPGRSLVRGLKPGVRVKICLGPLGEARAREALGGVGRDAAAVLARVQTSLARARDVGLCTPGGAASLLNRWEAR